MRALLPSELPHVGPAAMVMGVFDGVHLGHAHLLDATLRAAQRLGVMSVALVFDPHPDEVLRPGYRVPRLTPADVTLDLIRGCGVDRALAMRFDDDLRNLEPVAFLDALSPAIDLRALLMTPESAFGRKRAGTLDLMRTVGAERGFEAIAVDPLLDGGEPISSSRVRGAVSAGDLAEAARLLGRPHRLVGSFGPGPREEAVDLILDYAPCLPAAGTYRCTWHGEPGAVAIVGPDGVRVRASDGHDSVGRGTLELHERMDEP
jgi:riboflavin kinase / FMN adenylyltransferase